jgi:hypothetical protein
MYSHDYQGQAGGEDGQVRGTVSPWDDGKALNTVVVRTVRLKWQFCNAFLKILKEYIHIWEHFF